MSSGAGAAAAAAEPAVFVNIDGVGGYMEAPSLVSSMTNSRVLEALADSRMFKDAFSGVTLRSCKVYNMGSARPADNSGGTEMMDVATVRSSLPAGQEGAAHVFLRVDTSAAHAAASAAPVGGTFVAARGVLLDSRRRCHL